MRHSFVLSTSRRIVSGFEIANPSMARAAMRDALRGAAIVAEDVLVEVSLQVLFAHRAMVRAH